MHRTALALFIVAVFVYMTSLAQGQPRTFDFGSGSEVVQVVPTAHYFGVLVDFNHERQSAFVFDRSGNQLLEIRSGARGRINCICISDTLGYLIAVHPAIDVATEEVDGLLQAINFKTGREVWTAYSSLTQFKISPDGMRILPITNSISHGSRGPAGFYAVTLKDGSVTPLAQVPPNWYAEWLDTEHVVFATEEVTPNSSPSFGDVNSKRLQDLADSLYGETLKERVRLDQHKISPESYDSHAKALKIQIDSLRTERRALNASLTRARRLSAQRGTTRIEVLNLSSRRIETTSVIHGPNGESIWTMAGQATKIGTLNADPSSGRIYLVGYTGEQVGSISQYLVGLDRSLEKKFQVAVTGGLTKIVSTGEIIIAVRDGDSLAVFDKTSGNLVSARSVHTSDGEVSPADVTAEVRGMVVPGLRPGNQKQGVTISTTVGGQK